MQTINDPGFISEEFLPPIQELEVNPVYAAAQEKAEKKTISAIEVIQQEKMAAIGYGEFRPITPNTNMLSRQKNRRVVFFVKNDPAGQWVNGTLGNIEYLDEKTIKELNKMGWLLITKKPDYTGISLNTQFKKEITVDQVINSSMIADPLTLLDCSPITDGSASIILASEEVAKKFEKPVWIIGSGQANDTLSLHARKSLTEITATTQAVQRALLQAKMGIDKVDVTEVHDCFSIAEVMAIEDLGLIPRGEAGKIMEEGQTYFDGKIPINSCGGLKACGHPIGATGIKQAWEIVKQLRGEAGKRQVKGAQIGLTHNVGGTGSTVVVHVFSK